MRYFGKYAFALAIAALCAASGHAATIFNFTNFSSCTGLQVNGNAACTGGVLRVTPAIGSQSGSAFSTTLIPLSYAVNLAAVLGTTQAYVGFTSGTGAAWGNHDILTWQFDNTFGPIGAAATGIPALSDFALALAALLIAGAGWVSLRKRRVFG
jgi:hypothetical protein